MTDDAASSPGPAAAGQPDARPPRGSVGGPSSDDAAAEAIVTGRRIRELRETTGRHQELLGQQGERLASIVEQLREFREQLHLIGVRHADLAAAVSEDLALKVAGLQQVLTEELGQLRGDVDVLLSERAQREKTKNAPVDWASLTEEQAAAQWPILARWVGEVLVPRYEVTRDELPDCWALHPPVVVELSWLRTAHVAAYLTRSSPQLAADWHTRWRPAVLARIREGISPEECSPGRHAPRRGTALEVATQNGALPRTQLAEPQCWWPFYDHAYRADLAMRRARAAAGEFEWSPVTDPPGA